MRVGILIPLRGDAGACITRAAALGFESGQLSVWDMSLYSTETATQIKAACQKHHFTITALWCGWSGPVDWSYPGMYATLGLVPASQRGRRIEELLIGASFARMLGVNHIITHLGYLPDNPLDPTRVEIVHAIRHICKHIREYGQSFLFETGEELPLTLLQLIHDIGMENVGVNFDPANLLINARANPSDALELLLPFVKGMHAKDAVYPTGTSPKGKEMPIGQGRVDFPVLLARLAAAGYDGDITIEREIADGDTRNCDILDGKAYLEKIIDKLEAT